MTKSSRWPLMIDPQSQANRWIKEMRKDFGLVVTKLSDPGFIRILESAVRFGNSVLLENVEETLDPVLEPILRKDIKKSKNQAVMKLGDQEIPYNRDFKLYITTKMPNPHYVPEIVIKVTLINFTVTPHGLEDQLLIEVIKSERPELEEQRDNLIVQISDFNRSLIELQDKLLRQINDISGNILDDEDIITTLRASKATTETIGKGMAEATETSQKIDIIREEYRPVACRGSILYFVVAGLALIDPMYQYSLEFFINLFKIRLDKSEKNSDVKARIKILIKDVTSSVYKSICRGLFEKDKLLLSFLIASEIEKQSKKISPKEWSYFMIGVFGELKEAENCPDWLQENVWKKLNNLCSMAYHFKEIIDSIKDPGDQVIWKSIVGADDPQNIDLPEKFDKALTSFQKLLVFKTVCSEKLVFFIKEYVKKSLGVDFIQPPPFDLRASYSDSTCRTPIIFVLSSGADPMSKLLAFSKEKEMDGARFKILSLG